MSTKVFFTGATGYIGGAIFALLLETPSTKSFEYTALVRNKDKASLFKPFGVRPVIGSLEDADILSSEAEKADIIIHTAESADHLASSQAILSGIKKGGKNPIYIHISGIASLLDDARGEYKTDKVYSDLDLASINALPDNALHRGVDLVVLGAASYARTHIVFPPTIYGIADHPLVKAGISNPLSLQIPGLIRKGKDRNQAYTFGKGLNVWSFSHINDVAGAVLTVLEAAISGKSDTGPEGLYFIETGEYAMKEACEEVARLLSLRGIGTPEPTPLTEDEYKKYYRGSHMMAASTRARGDRTRRLGWSPKYPVDDFYKDIAVEAEYILDGKAAASA